MGTSKTYSFIFNRRLKVLSAIKDNRIDEKTTKKPVDDVVFDLAKKHSVSKVTIYNDLKYIRNHENEFA